MVKQHILSGCCFWCWVCTVHIEVEKNIVTKRIMNWIESKVKKTVKNKKKLIRIRRHNIKHNRMRIELNECAMCMLFNHKIIAVDQAQTHTLRETLSTLRYSIVFSHSDCNALKSNSGWKRDEFIPFVQFLFSCNY